MDKRLMEKIPTEYYKIKYTIFFIQPHLIGKVNGSTWGWQFDEMQLGKVGRGSYDIQVCIPLHVRIRWKDTKIHRTFQSSSLNNHSKKKRKWTK